MTILIVEDEEDSRHFLAALLEDEGHRVVQAGDGEEGLAQLRAHSPAIVLSDVHMPRLDGPTFIRQARERGSRATFIVISACPDGLEVDLGVAGVLRKPIRIEQVLQMTRQVAEQRSWR